MEQKKINQGGFINPHDIRASTSGKGMTRRDWLAGEYGPMIMLGDKIEYLFMRNLVKESPEAAMHAGKFKIARHDDVAERAYEMADKTIVESERTG